MGQKIVQIGLAVNLYLFYLLIFMLKQTYEYTMNVFPSLARECPAYVKGAGFLRKVARYENSYLNIDRKA